MAKLLNTIENKPKQTWVSGIDVLSSQWKFWEEMRQHGPWWWWLQDESKWQVYRDRLSVRKVEAGRIPKYRCCATYLSWYLTISKLFSIQISDARTGKNDHDNVDQCQKNQLARHWANINIKATDISGTHCNLTSTQEWVWCQHHLTLFLNQV